MSLSTREVVFELERFTWRDGAFEAVGRWRADRPGPLGRARLCVELDGERHRLAARDAGRVHAGPDGVEWSASFPWGDPPDALTAAELEVGRTLAVELPLPQAPRPRRFARADGASHDRDGRLAPGRPPAPPPRPRPDADAEAPAAPRARTTTEGEALRAERAGSDSDGDGLRTERVAHDDGQRALDEERRALYEDRAALAAARAELDEDRAALAAARAELDTAQSALDENWAALTKGRAELDEERRVLDTDRAALDEAQRALDSRREALEKEERRLGAARTTLEEDRQLLVEERRAFEEERRLARVVGRPLPPSPRTRSSANEPPPNVVLGAGIAGLAFFLFLVILIASS